MPLALLSLVACSDPGDSSGSSGQSSFSDSGSNDSGSGDSKPGNNVVINGEPIVEVFIASDVDPSVGEAIQATLDLAGDYWGLW